MADKRSQSKNVGQQVLRVLRIGVLQGGKIVHERLIKAGQSVTIGESEKNTFVFKAPNVPKRHLLFKAKGGQVSLCFTDEMDGMIALPGGVVPLKDARTNGAAELRGDSYVIALNQRSRGKVVIGDTTILFQYVAAPPESARLVARQNFRPLLLEDDDPVFLGFLSIWGALGSAVLIYALNSPAVVSVTADELPELFARLNVEDEEPEEPDTESEEVVNEELPGDEAPVEEEVVEETTPTEAPEEEQANYAAETEEVQEAVARDIQRQNAQELAMQSTLFAGRDGVLGTTGEGSGQQTVTGNMNFTRDQTNTSGNQAMGGLPSGDGPVIEEISSATQNSLADNVQGGSSAAQTGGTSGSQMESGELAYSMGDQSGYDETAGQIIERVTRTRRSRVLDCYNSELGLNPSASGQLTAIFDILDGSADNIEIEGMSTSMQNCVRARVRTWGFDGVDEAYGVELVYDLTPP